MKINKKIIEELTGYLKEFNLSEIEYAEGSTKVKVSKSLISKAVKGIICGFGINGYIMALDSMKEHLR